MSFSISCRQSPKEPSRVRRLFLARLNQTNKSKCLSNIVRFSQGLELEDLFLSSPSDTALRGLSFLKGRPKLFHTHSSPYRPSLRQEPSWFKKFGAMKSFLGFVLKTLFIGIFSFAFPRAFALFKSLSPSFSRVVTFRLVSVVNSVWGVLRFLPPTLLSFRTQRFTAGSRRNQTVESLKQTLAFVLGSSVHKSFQSFQKCPFRGLRHLSLCLSMVPLSRFTIERLLSRGIHFTFGGPLRLSLTFAKTGGLFAFTLTRTIRSLFLVVTEFAKKLDKSFKQIRFTISPTSAASAIPRGFQFDHVRGQTRTNRRLDARKKTT